VINERPIAVGAGYMVELLVEVEMGDEVGRPPRRQHRAVATTGRARR